MVIKAPKTESAIPASADLLLSVFKLKSPNTIPKILVILPHAGIKPTHKLIVPNDADRTA